MKINCVFKVLPRSDWEAACVAGHYSGSADDVRDGFIHFSTAEQLVGTLSKHFNGQDGLVLVSFETSTLGDGLKWEPSRGGELFPHLYGAVDTTHALATYDLPLDDLGIPQVPDDL